LFRLGGQVHILRAHVRITHQYDRLVASLPRENLDAVRIVEVMGALPLRNVAPAAGHVAGCMRVFEKVQGEDLVEEHGAHQLPTLLGCELFPGEPARLLQCGKVERAPDADGVEFRADRQR
jgi:hypothetical protein